MNSAKINQKRVNDIFLATISLDSFELDSIQIDALDSIAWQCPWSGGDAVFQARGMVSIVRDTVYNDSLLCAQQQYRLAGKPKPVSELMIYPNPADEVVFIGMPEDRAALSGELAVFNSLGQLMVKRKVNEADQLAELNTTQWNAGMYSCLVILTNGDRYHAQFIIVKP